MNRPNRPPRRLCLLLALLLGILPGCGRSAAPSRSADGIRVGVALYQQNDTFIATIVSSLEAAAREREADEGLKITLNITDGRGSQATQNEQIDRFLSTGYDVICVNLVDRTAAAVIVDKAKSAGIPLIFFNREPVREDIMRWDKVYYVGAEAGKSGVMQGELVAEAYRADPEALDRSGDGVLQYVMLEGEASGLPAAHRVFDQSGHLGQCDDRKARQRHRQLEPRAGRKPDVSVDRSVRRPD